jgi:hypothetical protein
VGLHVCHAWAEGGVKLEHGCDQVAELLREELKVAGLVLGMSSPEKVWAVGADELIEGV